MGRKMQTDLSDGVRYLAKAGIIDPTPVCIVGASYGGIELVAMKREDHWLSRSEIRLQMSQSSLAFLRANNPPD
jgi:hypothetical protein